MQKLVSSVFFAIALAACSTAQLNPNAAQVRLENAAPPSTCTNLGMVVGQGGGTFGGGWISNDKLVEYATNDARNKAADRGANYLQMNAPQLGGGGGTTTTATLTGIAYRCPDSVPATNAATASSSSATNAAN